MMTIIIFWIRQLQKKLDPRAARPYLFSDGQNMYNPVVSVCTVNLQNCTHFTYSLRTDSYVTCREYCKKIEIYTARHLLSAIFIARYLNIESKKHNSTYSLRLDFYPLYLGGFLIYYLSCQTNRRGHTSPKVRVVPGTWELAVGPS